MMNSITPHAQVSADCHTIRLWYLNKSKRYSTQNNFTHFACMHEMNLCDRCICVCPFLLHCCVLAVRTPSAPGRAQRCTHVTYGMLVRHLAIVLLALSGQDDLRSQVGGRAHARPRRRLELLVLRQATQNKISSQPYGKKAYLKFGSTLKDASTIDTLSL